MRPMIWPVTGCPMLPAHRVKLPQLRLSIWQAARLRRLPPIWLSAPGPRCTTNQRFAHAAQRSCFSRPLAERADLLWPSALGRAKYPARRDGRATGPTRQASLPALAVPSAKPGRQCQVVGGRRGPARRGARGRQPPMPKDRQKARKDRILALLLSEPDGVSLLSAPAIAAVLYSGNIMALSGQTRLQAGHPCLQLSGLSTRMRPSASIP